MKAFRIGQREVGGDNPVFIIAELSANHGQRLDLALKTIDAAADAGADAIKLQTYTPDTLTLKSDAAPFVVKTKNVWAGRTLHDLYAEAMTPWEWHAELMAAAKARGLECFSTPFDPTAVAFLEKLGVPCHKVASFELNDLTLVETIARTGKPMILSTGMATLEDIRAALALCREAGNEQLAVLRCVSTYPARPEAMDLRAYETLRELDVVLGLSDHTRDNTVAIASVALGAKVIEKHFILDRSIGGPDSFFSLDPAEFKAMVDAVRTTSAAMGRPRFGPSDDEVASTAFRRSLFVSAPVKAGETLTCRNVKSVRPSNGLHPRHLDAILGHVASRDLAAATPLALDMVGPERVAKIVTLRRATADDSARLLAWRNDPATRANSITADTVTPEQHAAFLSKALSSPDRFLLVCDQGTVRLDREGPASFEISLTVAPEARGQGYALALLRAGEEYARDQLKAVRLVAVIKPTNTASLRAFEQAGFHSFVEAEHNGVALLHCERRIVPYPEGNA